jgi:hypothetical protein
MGVMSSFSVAKKVTDQDINKFFKIHKKLGEKNSKIEKLLKERIIKDIEKAIMSNEIPGLLSTQELSDEMGVDKDVVLNIPYINKLIVVIVHKLVEKKYDKTSLCYFINGLVNVLGLTEEDFEKINPEDKDNEDGDEDGDEDGGEYK